MELYKNIVKPIIDLIVSLLLLILLSPLIFVIILLLAVSNRGSIFFLQQRPGLRGVPFYIIKFKTMNDAVDDNGILLPDEQRLTKIGRFVRSASLDELLQLINVVKGDMSLVGPRPLLMQYMERYTPEQARRHDVKPGITGLAQINGRNSISWKIKFKYDVFYVDKISLRLDIYIMWNTMVNVFKRKGINAEGSATMHEFTGTT